MMTTRQQPQQRDHPHRFAYSHRLLTIAPRRFQLLKAASDALDHTLGRASRVWHAFSDGRKLSAGRYQVIDRQLAPSWRPGRWGHSSLGHASPATCSEALADLMGRGASCVRTILVRTALAQAPGHGGTPSETRELRAASAAFLSAQARCPWAASTVPSPSRGGS